MMTIRTEHHPQMTNEDAEETHPPTKEIALTVGLLLLLLRRFIKYDKDTEEPTYLKRTPMALLPYDENYRTIEPLFLDFD